MLRITSYGGTVWGRVRVSYQSKTGIEHLRTCTRRTCKYYPPHDVTIVLTEIPRDSRTWPFRSWIIHNGGHLTKNQGRTLRVTIKGHVFNNIDLFKARIKANYFLP